MANGTFGGGDGSQGNPFLIEDDLDAERYFYTPYEFESYALLVNNIITNKPIGLSTNMGIDENFYPIYYNKHFDLNGYTYAVNRELNGYVNLLRFNDYIINMYFNDSIGTGELAFNYNKNSGSEFTNSYMNILQTENLDKQKVTFSCRVTFKIVGAIEFYSSAIEEDSGYLIYNTVDNYYFNSCMLNIIFDVNILTDKQNVEVYGYYFKNVDNCYVTVSGGISATAKEQECVLSINNDISTSNSRYDKYLGYILNYNMLATCAGGLKSIRDTILYYNINATGTHYIDGSLSLSSRSLADKKAAYCRFGSSGYAEQSYVNLYVHISNGYWKYEWSNSTGITISEPYTNKDKLFVNGSVIDSYGSVQYNYVSDADMHNKSTFKEFLFYPEAVKPIWGIDPAINEGYPYLLWYTYPTAKIGLFVQGKLGIIEIPTYSLSEVSGECIKFNSGKEVRVIKLVATTDSNALPIRIKTSKGIMSLSK